jgi:TPR repeat protein/membrane associated rhomboid family serine protease
MLLFLPVRAQIRLHKVPVATIMVSLLCLAIYYAQYRNERQIERAADGYCTYSLDANERLLWRRIGQESANEACIGLLATLHALNRTDPLLKRIEGSLTSELRDGAEAARMAGAIRASYERFAAQAPGHLTGRLWMERPSWNAWRWITASFAHGSWDHVIFNLIFFFAFAATVELLLGPVLFMASILFLSLFIGLTDTVVHLGQEPVPSLGLSGVVTGMLALFIYFVPRARIRFFFWFLFSVGMIGVPGWFVGLWYIGGDVLRVLGQQHSHVNYIAHLSGAAGGFLLGVTLFRAKRHWAQELVEERLSLTRDEGALRKLNAFTSAPLMLAVLLIGIIFVVGWLARFVSLFWLQLLVAAPVFAAVWQFYRWRQQGRPESVRVREATARQARGEYAKGRGELETLAAQGNARAMLALGETHELGHGVVKNLSQAVHWYSEAAQRGNAEAQYRLGRMSLEGRGLRKEPARIRDWWQRAVAGGHAQAAMSLAHLCENTVGTREVREQAKDEAAQWYYQAGRLFLKQRQLDDARMAASALRGLKADHPLALQLESEIAPAAAPRPGPNPR